MTRILKPAAALMVIMLAVFFIASCGGSDKSEAPVKKASTSKESSSKSSSGGGGGGDEAKPEQMEGQVIVSNQNLPDDFNESLESRRPIAVTFYMLGPDDDARVRTAMTRMESKYKGQMDFYTYLYSDGERYKGLASLLLVNTTPTVIMINEESRVTVGWTGYADEQSLEQMVVNNLGL
jgi:hypothetical protein